MSSTQHGYLAPPPYPNPYHPPCPPSHDMTTYPDTHRYLSPCNGPWFWHWDIESEDLAADVVVWTDGSTIAFRPEIRAVLESLAPDGLPPFDAVVLLLAACRDSWELRRWQLMNTATEANDSDLSDTHRAVEYRQCTADVASRIGGGQNHSRGGFV